MSKNNQIQLPDWLLLAAYAFKKHSVEFSVASDAITEGQDVLIQKYLKVTMMLKMHPFKAHQILRCKTVSWYD